MVRPDQSVPGVIGVPLNGRHLGNLLGVLLARLHAGPLGLLRAPLMSGGIILLMVLLSRTVSDRGLSVSQTLPVAAAMVILAPKGIWQQVYSWGSAYVNYLLPMLLLLALLLRMRHGSTGMRQQGGLFLLAVAATQFIEHVTIFLLVSAAAWLAWVVFVSKQKRLWDTAITVFFGAVIGTALMFLDPRYRSTADSVHAFGLTDVWEKLGIIAQEALLRPVALSLAISVLLVWLLVRSRGIKHLRWLLVLVPLHGMMIFRQVWLGSFGMSWSRQVDLGLGAVQVVCWLALACCLPKGQGKNHIFWLAAGLLVVNGALLAAAPVESRMFFPSYILLSMIGLELYRMLYHTGVHTRTDWLWAVTLSAVICLMGIYGWNSHVYQQRLQLAQTQVSEGADDIVLPLVPFTDFTVNETIGKGDISYQVYRLHPWDVKFTFQPYQTWTQQESPSPVLAWIARLWS